MSSEDTKSSAAFERRSRELLVTGSGQLDGHIRSRLTQARFAAVEAARNRNKGWTPWNRWLPAGSVAAAAAMAVLLWSGGAQTPQAPVSTAHSALEDIDVMVAEDSLEMFEDLEFYQWMDAESDRVSS